MSNANILYSGENDKNVQTPRTTSSICIALKHICNDLRLKAEQRDAIAFGPNYRRCHVFYSEMIALKFES